MRIIVRQAGNSFDALRTAEGMEKAGANVFSVTFNGMRQALGAMEAGPTFTVWAKYDGPEEARCDEIDRAISAEFGEQG